MVKAGLIIGGITFVIVLVLTIMISPLVAPCVGVFLGLAAGYLAGVYGKPTTSADSLKMGAGAGAMAAVLSGVGGLIGAVVNALTLTPEQIALIMQLVGIPGQAPDQTLIWIGQLGAAACIGFLNLIMAGFGAAGGALWYRLRGSKAGSMYGM